MRPFYRKEGAGPGGSVAVSVESPQPPAPHFNSEELHPPAAPVPFIKVFGLIVEDFHGF